MRKKRRRLSDVMAVPYRANQADARCRLYRWQAKTSQAAFSFGNVPNFAPKHIIVLWFVENFIEPGRIRITPDVCGKPLDVYTVVVLE
jgi:hypothetical protein